MQKYPMDLFDEMDALFARLFSGMDRDFMDFPYPAWYRIPVHPGEDAPEIEGNPSPDPGSRGGNGPVPEVHRIGDEVMVIADVPGISEEELRLDLRGQTLVIDTGDAGNHICTSVSLPPVDRASMHKTLRNGVLEVTLRVLPEA